MRRPSSWLSNQADEKVSAFIWNSKEAPSWINARLECLEESGARRLILRATIEQVRRRVKLFRQCLTSKMVAVEFGGGFVIVAPKSTAASEVAEAAACQIERTF